MRIKNYFLILSIFIIINSCKKAENPIPANIHAPVLTGFNFVNDQGDIYYSVGVPNVKLTDSENSNNYIYSIRTLPNPNYRPWLGTFSSDMFLFVEAHQPVQYGKIWVEKAVLDPSLTVTSNQIMGAPYLTANPVIFSLDSFEVNGSAQFFFDIENIEPGYYRLNVKLNDVHLWDNLIININEF